MSTESNSVLRDAATSATDASRLLEVSGDITSGIRKALPKGFPVNQASGFAILFCGRPYAWKWVLCTIATVLLQATASAQTNLIGPGVGNGDFNDDVHGDDIRNFSQTPYWSNIGTGDQGQTATRTNQDVDGSRNHQIGDSAVVEASNDTGHIISAGDAFDVSYVWLDAWQWQDGSDEVEVKLFTTHDGSIGGTQAVFASFSSGLSTNNGNYQAASGSASASSAEVGKRLFVSINGKNRDGTGFARLDNFVLTVTPTVAPTNARRLICYDAPVYRNGGFENAVGSTDKNWGAGLNVGACVRNSNPAYDGIEPEGTEMVNVSTKYRAGGLQNTDYPVKSNDTFNLSFDWTSASSWQRNHSMSWRLFTTSDDTTNGVISTIASGSVSGKIGNGDQWSTTQVLVESGVVAPASIGQDLWIELAGVSDDPADAYAFLDKVLLTVNTIKECTIYRFN